MDVEDRKHALYLRMHNVSAFKHVRNSADQSPF